MAITQLVIATFLYCCFHSLTASNQAKSLARHLFGPEADRWYRIVFNLLSGITFLPVLWLLATAPGKTLYTIQLPWLLLTIGGQTVGAVIILLGIQQTGGLSFLGFRQLISPPGEAKTEIFVDWGLYSWVRHPLYTGGLLVIWLTPMMTTNLLIVFLLLTLYLIVGAWLEEKRLVEAFGEVYERYRENVPMMIPRPPKGKRLS